jgi:hypothetical protein
MRNGFMIAGTAALLLGVPLHATRPADAPKARSQLLVEVARCRTILDSAQRLACFDTTVTALDAAEKRQDVVVIDRQQVREARRKLFGISMPDTSLFGGSPDVDHVDTVLTDAQVAADGRWSFRVADGARWIQTDDNIIGRPPKRNEKVLIKKGALGSFRLSIGGQPAVKVRRVN